MYSTQGCAPEPPACPTIVSAGRNHIRVSWETPLSNGAAITKYALYVRPTPAVAPWMKVHKKILGNKTIRGHGEVEWIEVGTFEGTEATIAQLPPGASFQVSVRAHNLHGWSKGSPLSAIMTTLPSEPDMPIAPKMILQTASSITVQWAMPLDNGDPIDNVHIQFRPVSAGRWLEFKTCLYRQVLPEQYAKDLLDPDLGWIDILPSEDELETHAARIYDLPPSLKIYVRVRMRNSVGYGPYATSDVITTLSTKPVIRGPCIVTKTFPRALLLDWSENAPSINGSPIESYEFQVCVEEEAHDRANDWRSVHRMILGKPTPDECKWISKEVHDASIADTHMYKLEGLVPGVQFVCRMRVKNIHGWSEYSFSKLDQCRGRCDPDVPAEPRRPWPDRIASRHVRLSWTVPVNNGQPVLSYCIEVSKSSGLEYLDSIINAEDMDAVEEAAEARKRIDACSCSEQEFRSALLENVSTRIAHGQNRDDESQEVCAKSIVVRGLFHVPRTCFV